MLKNLIDLRNNWDRLQESRRKWGKSLPENRVMNPSVRMIHDLPKLFQYIPVFHKKGTSKIVSGWCQQHFLQSKTTRDRFLSIYTEKRHIAENKPISHHNLYMSIIIILKVKLHQKYIYNMKSKTCDRFQCYLSSKNFYLHSMTWAVWIWVMAGRRSRFIASSAQVKIVTDKALESSTSKIALKNIRIYHLNGRLKLNQKKQYSP